MTDVHPSAAMFEAHMQAELEGDLDRTLDTMSPTPHLNHVPVMADGKVTHEHIY